MTKVAVHPEAQKTASQQIIEKALKETVITDGRGRKISLTTPGPLAQFRLIEAVGESAKNEVYMGMVLPLVFVSAIDGLPVPFPSTKAQLEALINRLDHDGIDAVMTAVNEMFGEQNPEADREALKK
jgi:hypothetical protein